MKQPTSLADYLSVWFSNYAPSEKILHTRVAFLMSLLFLYTALAVEKSRTWFSLDLPFDSPIFVNIFILLSIFSFSYLGYLYRDNLFNTNANVVVTLVCFYIIFKFIEGTMNFIFFSANWDVIWVNRRMIAVGPYFTSHGEEITRLWPTVYMMAVLLGCGYGSLGE